MDYGEIITALQHVVSCAGSLRLANCVGASPRCLFYPVIHLRL